MALNSLGLGFLFTAKDAASNTMRRVEGRFKKLDAASARSAAQMKRSLAMVGVGVAGAVAGGLALRGALNLANAAGNYERTMAQVGAITRASASEMQILSEAAKQAGIDTQFSPDEAAEGLRNFGALGFTAKESAEALKPALDLAAGGMISVDQATASVGAAMKVFGKEAGDATAVTDKLLRISNLTALQANDLQIAIGNVSRGAISARQSIEEMLPAIGLVKNSGVDASVAATSVSSALDFMARNAAKFKEKFGVDIKDANGDMRNFIDVVREVNEAGANMGSGDFLAALTETAGRFGKTAFVSIGKQLEEGIMTPAGRVTGEAAVEYMRNAIRDSAGAAKEFTDAMLDTFEGQKTLLRGSMQTLAIELGESFASVIKPMVSGVIRTVNAVIHAVKSIPAPVRKALATFAMIAAAAVTVGGAVAALVGVWGLVAPMLATVGAAFAAALPVLLAVGAGVAVVVAAFKVLRKAYDENLGGFATRLNGIYEKVKLYFSAIGQLMSGDGLLRGDTLTKLLDPANKSVLSMVQRFQQARFRIQQFFVGLKDGFMIVWRTMGPIFKALGEALEGLFAQFGFGGEALGLFTGHSEDFRVTGERVGEIVGNLAKILVSGLVGAVNLATSAVQIAKAAWAAIGPTLMITVRILGEILRAIGPVVAVIAEFIAGVLTAEAGVGKWIVTLGGLVAAIAYVFPMLGAMGAAILGPVGFVAAAAAAGLAIGTFIDQTFGISDAMSDWLLDITGVTEELNKLDAAYRKTVKTRGQVAAFDDFEAAAKAQGMTVTAFADKRAKEIAGEQTAQRLGLSENEIKQRLLSGRDVYAELAPGPEAAADGVVAQQDGEVGKGNKQAKQQEDAFTAALNRANGEEGNGKSANVRTTLKIDSQKVAEIVEQAKFDAGVLDFEADLSVAGGG